MKSFTLLLTKILGIGHILEDSAGFDFLGALKDFGQTLLSFFTKLGYLIPQLLYWVGSVCMSIIDYLQIAFRRVAGLDVYLINGIPISAQDAVIPGLSGSGDLILTFLYKILFTNEFSAISVAFQSLIVLSAIILFVVTIGAIIKNEYSPDKEKKNSKEGIIKGFFKAIVSFILIPITCFFGVWVGNLILYGIDQSIDTANTSAAITDSSIKSMLTDTDDEGNKSKNYTFYSLFGTYKATNYTTLTSICFTITGYSGNRIRNDADFYNEVWNDEEENGVSKHLGVAQAGYTQKQAADLYDALFSMNAQLKEAHTLDTTISSNDDALFFRYLKSTASVKIFDRCNLKLVNCYYNLWDCNLIIMLIFVVMILKPMAGMTLGAIKRLFNVLALFLMSPIVCSFMPIDGASSFKSWAKEFIRQVATLDVSVFAMNLFFMLCPILNSISIFGSAEDNKLLNICFNALLCMGALQAVESFDSLINLVVFGSKEGGLMKSGTEALKSTTDTLKSATGIAGNVAKIGFNAAKFGIGGAAAIGSGIAGGIQKRGGKANLAKSALDAGDKGKHKQEAFKDIQDNSELQQKYNKEVEDQTEENKHAQYEDYKASGGQLSEDEFRADIAGDKTSNYSASKAWDEMKPEEKTASGYKNKSAYMSAQYKEYQKAHPDSKMKYKDWKVQGDKMRADDAAGRSSHVNEDAARASATEMVDNRLYTAMEKGDYTPGDELTQAAVENYNKHKIADEQQYEETKKKAEGKTKTQRFARWSGKGAVNGLAGVGKVLTGAPKK